jgi:glycosyltransferase involved in cell wall biosynthesis
VRIAFLSFDFPEYCIRHANVMAEEHEVLLMLPENQLDGRDAMIDGRVRFEPFYRPRFREPFKQLQTVRRILRTVRQFQPDVVHYQHGHMYFSLALARLKRYPIVVTIHDPKQHIGDKDSKKTPQWIMDYGYRLGDRNIVHGRELVDVVHKQLGIARDRIHFIPHIAIGQSASSMPSDERGLRVLFFGRIWEYKGLEYFIKAQPIVSEAFPEAIFVIGGQGEDFERYRNMMADPSRFEIHNEWIGDDLRATLFSESAVVVLPYIEATQSGVVPIAYAHEKPVVVTRVGGLPEVVEDGVTGIVVEPRDVKGLANAIMELLQDPQKRHAMGVAGQRKLVVESDPHVVVPQTMEVYRHAIADRSKSLTVDRT